MSLALVDHEGRPFTIEKPTTPPVEVAESARPSLDELAAKQAVQQSTKAKGSKQ